MGAANNTLLFIDNLQLLVKEGDTTGIHDIQMQKTPTAYDLQGRRIQNIDTYHGIYIVRGKKIHSTH